MTGNTENGLFRCPVKVRPGPGCDMPAHLRGAFVDCFVGALDHMAALRRAVERLSSKGFVFEDLMDGKVHQHDPHQWDDYVATAWPELVSHFPAQAEVLGLVQAGEVFFGPFCGWESETVVVREPDAPPKGISTFDPGDPEFVGQQSGAGADLLQSLFRAALVDLPQVQRAYFCMLHYPGDNRGAAAVCVVCSTGEDGRVVQALATLIRGNLGAEFHIDVLFLSPSTEERLASVCRPFYERP